MPVLETGICADITAENRTEKPLQLKSNSESKSKHKQTATKRVATRDWIGWVRDTCFPSQLCAGAFLHPHPDRKTPFNTRCNVTKDQRTPEPPQTHKPQTRSAGNSGRPLSHASDVLCSVQLEPLDENRMHKQPEGYILHAFQTLDRDNARARKANSAIHTMGDHYSIFKFD